MTIYAEKITDDKKIVGITKSAKLASEMGFQYSFEEMEVEQAYDGGWYLEGYAPKKPDEVLAEEKRAIRNQYLTDADKYMLPDFPVSDEERALWVKYREYLRNITKAPNFPNVDVLNFKNWKEQINDKEVVDAE